jgi:hypothetical protein
MVMITADAVIQASPNRIKQRKMLVAASMVMIGPFGWLKCKGQTGQRVIISDLSSEKGIE